MYEYRVHTLVDITYNGNLQRPFPFKTPSGDLIHDKQSLAMARNQNANFNTMIQLLQMRGNITWEEPPMRIDHTINKNFGFGTFYDGSQHSWHFKFFTEQDEVYGDLNDSTGELIDDFNQVPIISFCKETVTFPNSTFITRDDKLINTYFSYGGFSNK